MAGVGIRNENKSGLSSWLSCCTGVGALGDSGCGADGSDSAFDADDACGPKMDR